MRKYSTIFSVVRWHQQCCFHFQSENKTIGDATCISRLRRWGPLKSTGGGEEIEEMPLTTFSSHYFDSDDGGSMSLRSVFILLRYYEVSLHRKTQSEYSLSWESDNFYWIGEFLKFSSGFKNTVLPSQSSVTFEIQSPRFLEIKIL
jgi:hypothetical protein